MKIQSMKPRSQYAALPYRVTGGAEVKILKKNIVSEKPLGRSLMLSAAQLGCTAQDVADIVAYLRAGAK